MIRSRWPGLVALVALAFAADAAVAGSVAGPKGWYLYQVIDGEYQAGLDGDVVARGNAGRLRSVVTSPTSYGLIAQAVRTQPWRNKRVRFSALVRTDSVEKYAGLFMRVDGPDRDPNHSLALDTMDRRPLRGSKPWTRVSIVLDVAETASQLVFGAFMVGAGTLWLDEVRMEEVDLSVPTTDYKPPEKPQNTDFED